MSVVPLRYRAVELRAGETAPPRRRWVRLVLWGLAADATFVAAALGTLALRGQLG